ncbi:Smr/MutS family protein [Methylovirgula sp. HY1]|uniref:Smr/MutS family protein n=1 Tax=Methylovirgula sp. HY1 TaxID=2822761 RepID=UPI001C5AF20E|nr:Smr/MutS family protein [Methylovirgula sp. HY1]QXX75498.1 Endonuclease MutS2 [Methylovirgula sp. HY1]
MRESAPPARRRLRRLSDEEIALWLTVTRSVKPRPDAILPASTSPLPEKPEAAPSAPPVAPQKPPQPPPRGAQLPRLAPLDRRLKQRLTRGKVEVDAVIDLHGLHQQEAHASLQRFLLRAQSNGAKLVLVVTGKGEGRAAEDYGGGGVLRRSVPHWLGAPDWRGLVVGFEEASRPHGGAGALYVRLRRRDRREP